MRRSLSLLVLALFGCADDGAPPLGSGSSGDDGSSSGSLTATGTAGTTGGASSTSSSTTTQSSGSSTGDTPGVFELRAQTVITDDGRLALDCNLPPAVDDCLALTATGAPCDDADADDLVDAWEDVALDMLRPRRRFDEAEQFVGDPNATAGDVGRVIGIADHIRLFVMLGYSRDYGSCAGFTGHNGDSERVVADLVAWPDGDVGGVVFDGAYTAAHEGTITDESRTFQGDELSALVIEVDPNTEQPRWIVFPSADKHATYASVEICEAISMVPCVDEDCGPDGVDDPLSFDVLPLVVNAGEPDAPRNNDLTQIGFPGETAWGEEPFCGGLGGVGCPPSVRDKLLMDPF